MTVNDYLARRDAEWMRPIYEALGMTVGVIEAQMDPDARKAAYACDITYGTNSEFGFDYLRDNLAIELEETVQRPHAFAIVDEVDSILVDEARTPLIIAGQPEESSDTYYTFAKIVKGFKLGEDYEVDEKRKTAAPTEQGVAKTEKALGIENLYAPGLEPDGQPPDPGAARRVAVPQRRRVPRRGRRGQDRRRVHRPHHGRAAAGRRACTRPSRPRRTSRSRPRT